MMIVGHSTDLLYDIDPYLFAMETKTSVTDGIPQGHNWNKNEYVKLQTLGTYILNCLQCTVSATSNRRGKLRIDEVI